MTYYRRRTLETWEEAAALAAGAVVGLGAAYLVRTWLRRSPTSSPASRRQDPKEEGAEDAPGIPRSTEGAAGRPR